MQSPLCSLSSTARIAYLIRGSFSLGRASVQAEASARNVYRCVIHFSCDHSVESSPQINMNPRWQRKPLLFVLALVVVTATGYLTRHLWLPQDAPAADPPPEA